MQRASFHNLQDLLSPSNQGGAAVRARRVSGDSDDSYTSATNKRRLVFVANQLPLKAVRKDGATGDHEFEWDEDALFYQAKKGVEAQEDQDIVVMFIGQLSVEIDPAFQEAVSQMLISRFNCAPVFLSASNKERFYKGMCKQIMWPLFHYVLPMSPTSQSRFDHTLWQAYIAANKKFTDRVVELLAPENDFVWVQDYHLLLLPTLLRKRFHTVRIGFFLHCPFPSSEMFRAFPMRSELLRGLLNADLVGFHTFDYARHFLSCCSRMLGLEFQSKRGSIELEYFGRQVRVRISPVGVQVDRLRQVLASSETTARIQSLERQFADKILIVGVDDFDPFKGIDLKCQAIEALLRQHPEMIGKVVLVQVANSARIVNKDVVEMRDQVLAEVTRVNSKFTDYTPIELWERSVPLHERVALYSMAQCVLVTATRDGMNLVPYEYVVCRQGLEDHTKSAGSMLVVSEFVGCTPSLSGALRINPWNVEDTADHLYHAITMSQPERVVRHEQHFRYIKEHSVHAWARNYLTAFQNVCEELSSMKTYGLGFGLGFRVVALQPHFRHLEVAELVAAIPDALHCCFLLDYDGTLTQERGCSLAIPPSAEVLALLSSLVNDCGHTVCIVSGRGRRELEEWFSSIPDLGIAAEHGCFYRNNAESGWKQAKGENMLNEVALWKRVALPILESYAEATDGSFIQDKESAVVWHFNNADPDFGTWQSKELVTHLEDLLVGHPVDVNVGGYTVEIKPKGITKAEAVEQALKHMAAAGKVANLVVCIGDDRSDEDMFVGLESGGIAKIAAEDCKVFSATVGQKPSRAPYYVNDPFEVEELLHAVVSLNQKPLTKRSYSLPCLNAAASGGGSDAD
mmetsp:Transcript_22797/g.49979  ORF Transcript_22797/g.49979 Transcript_22797/m.49979 type:complete len:855 (-) Transcript_22797:139-2703(-)|eukprot:CAMPEP_0118921492 /NCGR_PEP_ID=MMETSP1169-20130426/740_1 /TAXON_ID=36882 /ORGANISM="Pyramimonas obovata, Strain CCMP722" /LENGTH=854 /DNA_ID=CAMNT_0006862219 /DNA_START=300 /DNA_END=2864 /DNA_ORIENTATION=+